MVPSRHDEQNRATEVQLGAVPAHAPQDYPSGRTPLEERVWRLDCGFELGDIFPVVVLRVPEHC